MNENQIEELIEITENINKSRNGLNKIDQIKYFLNHWSSYDHTNSQEIFENNVISLIDVDINLSKELIIQLLNEFIKKDSDKKLIMLFKYFSKHFPKDYDGRISAAIYSFVEKLEICFKNNLNSLNPLDIAVKLDSLKDNENER